MATVGTTSAVICKEEEGEERLLIRRKKLESSEPIAAPARPGLRTIINLDDSLGGFHI